MHHQLWGYKVEEQLHLGVREQKVLNISGLECVIPLAARLQLLIPACAETCIVAGSRSSSGLLDRLANPNSVNAPEVSEWRRQACRCEICCWLCHSLGRWLINSFCGIRTLPLTIPTASTLNVLCGTV
jgi:hypothetical protein